MAERDTPTAEQLARDVISLAAAGGMPDSFWGTDSRIARACEVLGITTDEACALPRSEETT